MTLELLIPPGPDREKLRALDIEENEARERQMKRGKIREHWKKTNKSVTMSESYKIMTLDGHKEWEDLNRISRIREEKEKIIKKYVAD